MMCAGLRFPVIALLFVFLAALSCCDAADCLVSLADKTVMSDPDGDGPQLFPSSCTSVVTCALDENIVITYFHGIMLGSAWFTVSLINHMEGVDMLFHDLPISVGARDATLNDAQYQVPGINVTFINRGDTSTPSNPSGGFILRYRCVKVCQISDLLVATGSRKGTFEQAFQSEATTSEVCTMTIEAPPCHPWEMVSYTLTKYPEYLDDGATDPLWKAVLGHDTLGQLLIFPNDYVWYEQFFVDRPAFFQLRAMPNKIADVAMDYYCTPVGNCTHNHYMDYPYGAIISDEDGQGYNPYGPGAVDCEWIIQCPYDTNVFFRVLEGNLKYNVDFLYIKGRLTDVGTFSHPVISLPDGLALMAERVNFRFVAQPNVDQFYGFTAKYECIAQCAVASPQSVTLNGTSGSIIQPQFMALAGHYDMCRKEIVNSCASGNTLELLVYGPGTTNAWKLIIDHVYNPFEIVYPNASIGNTIWIPNAPFNVSVRVAPQKNSAYQIDYECVNSAKCDSVSYTDSYRWDRGVFLSDFDGDGVNPYTAGPRACTWLVQCNVGEPVVLSIQGSINLKDALYVQDTKYFGTLSVTNPISLHVRVMNITFVVNVLKNTMPGFVLRFACQGTSPPDTGPTITLPTKTTAAATTAAPSTASPTSSPCSVAVDCYNHAFNASIRNGTCTCACYNAWSGPSCAVCEARYNASDNCSSCAYGFEHYYPCPAHFYSETNWTMGAPLKDLNPWQKYEIMMALQTDLQRQVDKAHCNSTPNMTIRVTVVKTVDDKIHTEVEISSIPEEDARIAAQCVHNALVSPYVNTSTVKAVVDKLLPNHTAIGVVEQTIVRRSPCGLGGCPPPEAPPLAAPEDSDVGVIVGSIIGALLLLLLLLLLLFLLLRKAKVAFTDVEIPFFTGAGKYTKEFAVKGDDELLRLSKERTTNLNNLQEDQEMLTANMFVATPGAMAAAAPSTVKSTKAAPPQRQPPIEEEDLLGTPASHQSQVVIDDDI